MRFLHDIEEAFNGPQQVVDRAKPCRCGCAGADPQHRATFRRVLRGVRRHVGVWATTRWGADVVVVATATFRHPGLGARQCGLERTFLGNEVVYQWVSLETGAERAARLTAEAVEANRVSRELVEMFDCETGEDR